MEIGLATRISLYEDFVRRGKHAEAARVACDLVPELLEELGRLQAALDSK